MRVPATLFEEGLSRGGKVPGPGVSLSSSSKQLGCPRDLLQHVAKDQPMDGVEGIPIQMSEPARGIELGRLPQRATRPVRFDLEFEPGPSRENHLGAEPEPSAGFQQFHAPEIDRIARAESFGITPAPAQPNPSCQ